MQVSTCSITGGSGTLGATAFTVGITAPGTYTITVTGNTGDSAASKLHSHRSVDQL